MRTGISTGPGVNRRWRVNARGPALVAGVELAGFAAMGGVTDMVGRLPSLVCVGAGRIHRRRCVHGNDDRGFLRATVERVLEHLVHGVDADEREVGAHFLRHLAQVLLRAA